MPLPVLPPPARTPFLRNARGCVGSAALRNTIADRFSDYALPRRGVSGRRRAGPRAWRLLDALSRWAPSFFGGEVARNGGVGLNPAQLLAGVTHDLLTPITRMKLRAEMIGAFSVREKFFSDLDEMEGLIRDVLAYAGSARSSAESCVELKIAAFLESLACDYQEIDKDVVAGATVPGVILTRPRLLRRIITNLVDNALKFAGAAMIVAEMRENTFLMISVLDRGPGIPGEQLAAVIEPFFRLTRDRSAAQGFGLGLAIAHNLANTLGGSIALRNRKGGGLRAELRLPLSRTSSHTLRYDS